MRQPIHIEHPTKRIRCYVPDPPPGKAGRPHHWVCEIDGAAFDMGIVAGESGRSDAEEQRVVRKRALELAGPDTGP